VHNALARRRYRAMARRKTAAALLLFALVFLGSMTDLNRVTSLLNSIMHGTTWPVVPAAWTLRLMTANGSGSSNGTELTGVTGYTAGDQSSNAMTAWTSISGTTAAITGPPSAVSWTNSGGSAWTAVTGIEIWDRAGTPLRWFWGALSGGSVTVNAGNTLQFAINSISLSGTTW
jgi:hypothetical protein